MPGPPRADRQTVHSTMPTRSVSEPLPPVAAGPSPAPCAGCSYTAAPARPGRGDGILLATHIDHTLTTMRTLARGSGLPVETEVLGSGLLRMRCADPAPLITALVAGLTAAQSAEVRCLVLDSDSLTDLSVLTGAMTAPSLQSAAALMAQDELLMLFADEEESFHSVYQPIVDFAAGRVCGHEALLRAHTPDGEQLLPDAMFAAATASGHTNLLDRIGRTTALRGAQSWLGEDLLFINFISTSIYRPEVCLRTTQLAARRAGIPMRQLVFEVTESHETQDVTHLETIFNFYHRLGTRVALDDLGAGYSSLNMLLRLQPDIVKLDKELVQDLPSVASTAIISAIVVMTHAYGGQVLAEGVETEAHAAAAIALGVDLGQGWLFGRPAPAPTPPATIPSNEAAIAWARTKHRQHWPPGELTNVQI